MLSVIPPVGVPFNWRFALNPGRANPDTFRRKLSDYLGGETILTNSGKTALSLILWAASLNFPEKDEVIIPAYTCWSVPSAVAKAGLRVRPVDINPDNFGSSPLLLGEAISKKTIAVVVTHLFGIPSEIDRIEAICREKEVLLIDDAAQGFGASLGDRPLGSFGDAGILSFGRGKNITTLSGGAATIRDKRLAKTAREIAGREFRRPRNSELKDSLQLSIYKLLFSRYLYWIPDALPFLKLGETFYNPDFDFGAMPSDRAVRGLEMMDELPAIVRTRKNNADKYLKSLSDIESIQLPSLSNNSNAGYLRFPVLLKHENIRRYIIKKGHNLGISGMYPGTVDSIEPLKKRLAANAWPCPEARRVSRALITLPTHYGINDRDIKRIAALIAEAADSDKGFIENKHTEREEAWRN